VQHYSTHLYCAHCTNITRTILF